MQVKAKRSGKGNKRNYNRIKWENAYSRWLAKLMRVSVFVFTYMFACLHGLLSLEIIIIFMTIIHSHTNNVFAKA